MPQEFSEHTPPRVEKLSPHPVYVPSRGRPQSSTLRLLRRCGVPHFAVVEPFELEKYQEAACVACDECDEEMSSYSEWVVLPQNDQGIAYVRNFVKSHATAISPSSWYWMLDDDILATFIFENGKSVKTPIGEVLVQAQRVISRFGQLVGQGALEYNQLAWCAKQDHAIGYCDVAVCIHTERTRELCYRQQVELKEDRDFTLQVLHQGLLSIRATRCAFAAPKNGSNKGGLYEVYRAHREEQASRRMEALWPGVCSFHHKKGRPDVKINWGIFRPARHKL